jgi:hypothetical protein
LSFRKSRAVFSTSLEIAEEFREIARKFADPDSHA